MADDLEGMIAVARLIVAGKPMRVPIATQIMSLAQTVVGLADSRKPRPIPKLTVPGKGGMLP